jgi:YggT family protein
MILNVIWFFIVAHFIMSWLISFNVLNFHQPIVSQIWQGLNRILDPIYSRIRQFIPNMGGLDLAPLVALLIVAALQYTLAYYG